MPKGSLLENLIQGEGFLNFALQNNSSNDPAALIEALNNILGMLSSFTNPSFYMYNAKTTISCFPVSHPHFWVKLCTLLYILFSCQGRLFKYIMAQTTIWGFFALYSNHDIRQRS